MCKSIDICGMDYKVKMVDFKSENGRQALGLCDTISGEIKINKKQTKQSMELTMLHEWMHGVLDVYGIDHKEEIVGILSLEAYRRGFRIKEFK